MQLGLHVKTWIVISMLAATSSVFTLHAKEFYPDEVSIIQKRPLVEVLEELGEKYEVFFSFDADLLKGVEVHYEFRKEEVFEDAVHRLLAETELSYKYLGKKYYVVYKNNRSGSRKMRRMQRKIKQLQKLEDKGDIALYPASGNKQDRLRQIAKSVEKLVPSSMQVRGTVRDEAGEPLIGATVLVKGTVSGANTDQEGAFSIECAKDAILVFSYVGYSTQEVPVNGQAVIDVVLLEGLTMDGVTLVGTRGRPRTQLETVVPVDVINATTLEASPQAELAQVLQYAAPSFHSTKQNIGHGSDHIDPMALRGLGADQTLVLINGKRRHTTSLMNVNGTVARGQVGTDLNSIPMAAVERIEVLRDGAAAQYGSDAIAGVINIVLKKNINKGEINVRTGFLAAPPEAPAFLQDFNPYADNSNLASTQGLGGGENLQLSANYGIGIGEKGGFLNLTLNYLKKNPFNRMDDYTIEMFSDERRDDPVAEFAVFNQGNPDAIAAYNARWGDQFGFAIVNPLSDFEGRRVANMGGSGTTNAGIMFNSELPINKDATFYAFGGYNYRLGRATGFYRRPNQIGRQSGLWPLGFSPHLDSDIQDLSAAVGVKSKFKGWNVDLSNTFGANSFDWTIFNSNNA
ncbi:MAG: TonB-dependent receptor plug domain-containing protein, partial [Bacteroidota bacterium]